jgi:DNA-binding IclR family transcriptional regulator
VAGKSVLAHLESGKLMEIVNELKEIYGHRIDENRIMKALDEVRTDGFAINDEEFSRGIRAIGVPVFSANGIACSINVVVEPEEVSVEELRNRYAPRLIGVGKELSAALGCRVVPQ